MSLRHMENIKKPSNLSHSSKAKKTDKLQMSSFDSIREIIHQLFYTPPLIMPISSQIRKQMNISTLKHSSASISMKDQSNDQGCMSPSALGSFQSRSAWPIVGRPPETGFYVLPECVAWNTALPATSLACRRKTCVGSTSKSPVNQCGQLIASQAT